MTISHFSASTGYPVPRESGVRLRRRTLFVLLGLCGVSTTWAGATTGYLAFRDEIAPTLLARQTELRYAYEDRIDDLKSRLEREITANLVERTGSTARTQAVAARQAEIEARQAWLAGMVERLGGGSPAVPVEPLGRASSGIARPRSLDPPVGAPSKPAPLTEEPPVFRSLLPESAGAVPVPNDGVVSAVETSLRRVSDESLGTAESVRRTLRDRALRVRLALEATRLDPKRLARQEAASGGPFVPLPASFDSASLAPIVADAESSLSELGQLASSARSLPLGRPLAADLEQTSPFGYRVDPFTRAPALHTGADFRAEFGGLVRATAPGRVAAADVAAGYGNLVEIEHAGSVSTRYGHLSAILVVPGQQVAAGQVIGRAGSTGRSTGTHLHYEVRIDGEPVDPLRFLEAGRLLATLRP